MCLVFFVKKRDTGSMKFFEINKTAINLRVLVYAV